MTIIQPANSDNEIYKNRRIRTKRSLYTKQNKNISEENIIGSSIGRKIINGILTDTISYKFFVKEKKRIEDLKPEEIIPNTINHLGQEYITDVVELRNIKPIGCYDWTPDTDTPTPEQARHRERVRPLQGGISIVNNTDMSYTAGTLGMIARDSLDGSVVGLTNAHVLVAPHRGPVIVSDAANIQSENYFAVGAGVADILGNVPYNLFSKNVSQPSPYDQTYVSANDIGSVKRFYPIPFRNTGSSSIDAALVHIKDSTLITGAISGDILNLTAGALPWATDAQIDTLITNNVLLSKSGRTTGSNGALVGCNIVCTDLDLTIEIQYNSFLGYISILTDCIGFVYANRFRGVLAGGDSGSILVGNINGIPMVVGLCFAGSNLDLGGGSYADSGFGIACRITNIANLLNISRFDPSDIRISNTNNWKYKLSDDNRAKGLPVTTIDDEKYWQIGTVFKRN